MKNIKADYRIVVSPTKGEQILVERQFQASPGKWITVSKYMTADLAVAPKGRSYDWAAKLPPATILIRCTVCGWPLAENGEPGCSVESCSYRPPEGTTEYARIQERLKELAQGEESWNAFQDRVSGTMKVLNTQGMKEILGGEYVNGEFVKTDEEDAEKILPKEF